MSQTYVLYHGGGCPDGFGAALAARQRLGEGPEVVYLPVKHGEPMPEIVDGSTVYIVDFSYGREDLLALAARTTLQVLDHHVSAQRDLEGLPFAHFDMTKSGCVLTWEHFFPEVPVPRLLLLLQDRDLWQFKVPDCHEIFAALISYKMEAARWKGWLLDEASLDALKVEGVAIMRTRNKMVSSMVRNGIMATMAGYPMVVANCTALWSEVGHELLERFPLACFSATWHRRSDGRESWSLRGRPDGVDVSAIAKALGGGGHASAAGFVMNGTNNGQVPTLP